MTSAADGDKNEYGRMKPTPICQSTGRPQPKHCVDRFPFGDFVWPVELVEESGVVPDPKQVGHGRRKVCRLDGSLVNLRSFSVAGTDHLCRANPGPSHHKGPDITPVIAPPGGIERGRSPHFSDGDDQCFRKHPTLLEVFDQRWETRVELRTQDIFHPLIVLRMGVPERIPRTQVARIAQAS